jgi:Helix-turn-helix domain
VLMTLEQRLENIETMLIVLVERQQLREWYTTREFARTVGKADLTIREYCRRGRLRAEKRNSGRGAYPQWVLARAELERYQREGLLRSVHSTAGVR